MKKIMYIFGTLAILAPAALRPGEAAPATPACTEMRTIIHEELTNVSKEFAATLKKVEQVKVEEDAKQQMTLLAKEKDALTTWLKTKAPVVGKTIVYIHLTKRVNEATTLEQLNTIRSTVAELEKLILGL